MTTGHTIKVVIIGESGVGKTSLRNQYTTSRFSPAYRATIGLDFHSTALSEPACTLQIWDTAGQDRFAPLSRAFYRGADAVLLVFDCTRPRTLGALKRWWGEFEGAEGGEGVVVVGVGNKLDLRKENGVQEGQAREFLDELLPERARRRGSRRENASSVTAVASPPIPDDDDTAPLPSNLKLTIASSPTRSPSPPPDPQSPLSSLPISMSSPSLSHPPTRSRSASRTRDLVGTMNTMTTIGTHASIYHTPSSSLFDQLDAQLEAEQAPTPPATPPHVRKRQASASSQNSGVSSSSAATATPRHPTRDADDLPLDDALAEEAEPESVLEPHSDSNLALFFTSSLDRGTICPVFEYVARQVIEVREDEERRRERDGVAVDESGEETRNPRGWRDGWIRLGDPEASPRCCGT